MTERPSGIVQFQILPDVDHRGMTDRSRMVIYGLADDGRIYHWENNMWVAVTHNNFNLRGS